MNTSPTPDWRKPGPARDRRVQRVIIIEGLANLCVLLAKTAVGLSTGSLAILADAAHSLTDLANNIVAWIVVRLAAQPPDREHPYGHRKFETLAVFGLATLLTVIAVEIALQALRREQPEILQSDWGLVLMLGVLLINIAVTTWQRMWARRLQSDILLADASHTLADVAITSTVIIGWLLSASGYHWLDTLCALLMAALVLYLAFGLFKRAIPVLVDHSALDSGTVGAAVLTLPGVRQVRRLRSRWQGSSRVVDMIITVDASLSTEKAHRIADQIEALLEERFGASDITIHIEPEPVSKSV
ncbi:MAG: cation diffusion facilitator family transporter [Gammaproteobacteria bacterium]